LILLYLICICMIFINVVYSFEDKYWDNDNNKNSIIIEWKKDGFNKKRKCEVFSIYQNDELIKSNIPINVGKTVLREINIQGELILKCDKFEKQKRFFFDKDDNDLDISSEQEESEISSEDENDPIFNDIDNQYDTSDNNENKKNKIDNKSPKNDNENNKSTGHNTTDNESNKNKKVEQNASEEKSSNQTSNDRDHQSKNGTKNDNNGNNSEGNNHSSTNNDQTKDDSTDKKNNNNSEGKKSNEANNSTSNNNNDNDKDKNKPEENDEKDEDKNINGIQLTVGLSSAFLLTGGMFVSVLKIRKMSDIQLEVNAQEMSANSVYVPSPKLSKTLSMSSIELGSYSSTLQK